MQQIKKHTNAIISINIMFKKKITIYRLRIRRKKQKKKKHEKMNYLSLSFREIKQNKFNIWLWKSHHFHISFAKKSAAQQRWWSILVDIHILFRPFMRHAKPLIVKYDEFSTKATKKKLLKLSSKFVLRWILVFIWMLSFFLATK